MPHDVIMPALGMAQDTGVIVAWLKAPGESVSAGEPLLEVETDKATMEVEAAHDGFLTSVRAGAGDSVPVGEVVAIIAETPDGAAEAPAPAAGADAPPAADGSVGGPQGAKVIMPALGMAQDTGKIVAWLKQPGEAVAAGEALLEVETDKATMEVEADTAGFLAAVYAPAGADVPVGDTIAVISGEKPAAPVTAGSPQAASPSGTNGSQPAKAAEASAKGRPAAAATAPVPVPRPRGDAPAGRVLASPKARRLARERGLDLAALFAAAEGHPIHVGDLDRLAAAAARPVGSATATPLEPLRIEADAPRARFAEFLVWLDADTGAHNAPGPVFAAFAASALREASTGEPVAVRLETPGKAAAVHLHDPDLGAGEARPAEEAGEAPKLVVRDLTGSHVTGMRLGALDAPVLTIARRGETFAVTLEFTQDKLSADDALELVNGFAERLAEPLRQLL